MRILLLTAITMYFSINTISAQALDLGSWNILNLKYNLDKKWSVFGEAQLRSLKFYSNFHYYEYKGGINYKVHKNVTLSLGAGSYQTYKEGGNFVLPKNNDEFRIWPQIILFQSIGKLKVGYLLQFDYKINDETGRDFFQIGYFIELSRKTAPNSSSDTDL